MTKILCWCENDVPAYSCLFRKSIMNPIGVPERVWIVTRWGLDQEPYDNEDEDGNAYDLALDTPYSGIAYETDVGNGILEISSYIQPAGPWVLASGPTVVPAKTPFYADMPFLEVCDMAYHDDADPTAIWFMPRDDAWSLMSVPDLIDPDPQDQNNIVTRAGFKRYGYHNQTQKTVPVLNVPVLSLVVNKKV